MEKAEAHVLRSSTLEEYLILDSPREDAFDRLTALAERYTDASIAFIGFLDVRREWFKSIRGGPEELTELPLEQTFCRCLLEEDQLVVTDATQDERFSSLGVVEGPLHIRSYAGIPVKAFNGETIGSFCLLNDEPCEFDEDDLELLRTLGKQVEELLEFRRARGKMQFPAELPSDPELTQRLAMLYDYSKNPFYMVDEEWRFVYVNSACAEFLGRDRAGLIGSVLWDVFPKARSATFKDRMVEVVETKESQTFELFFKPLDAWFRIRLIYADPGVAVFYDDITDRILRMRQVTDEEERLRLLIEATHDAFFDWNPIAGTLLWSSGVKGLTGYSPEEVTDEEYAWQNLVHPDDLERSKRIIETAFENGDESWNLRARWIHRDGRVIRVAVNGSIIRDRNGTPIRALGGIADETDRVVAADRMQMLAALIDRASDAIIVYDRDGRIEFWNESARDLYGWSAEETRGHLIQEVLYDDPGPFLEAQAELLAEGEWRGKLTQRDRDGNLVDVEVKWTLVPATVDHTDRILAIQCEEGRDRRDP